MDGCLFCKIAKGEIPSATVYEDETFRVILDMNQAIKGHMLILPKEHYANLYELPDETAAAAMVLAKKLARASHKAYHTDGCNLLQNNGEAAGQSVMHFHLHVLPRLKGDDPFPQWLEKSVGGEELAKTAEEIKAAL